MENQQPEALVLARLFERCVIAFGETETSSRAIAAKELRRLHARVQELEAMLDAVGAGGVSAQRVTQVPDHIAQIMGSRSEDCLQRNISTRSIEMSAERTWTGNSEVDAAIVMLDRIDCSPEDDSRVDEVEATLRRLRARVYELEKEKALVISN